MKAHEVLEKAAQHMRDRAATYDKPEGERSMEKTVAAFNAITGQDLTTAEDGPAYLALLAEEMLSAEPAPFTAESIGIITAQSPGRDCRTCAASMSSDCFTCDPRQLSNWKPR